LIIKTVSDLLFFCRARIPIGSRPQHTKPYEAFASDTFVNHVTYFFIFSVVPS
jgi:hypothetical protein